MNQTAIFMWMFFLYDPENNPYKSSVILAPKSRGISKCLEGFQPQRIMGKLYRNYVEDNGSFQK